MHIIRNNIIGLDKNLNIINYEALHIMNYLRCLILK